MAHVTRWIEIMDSDGRLSIGNKYGKEEFAKMWEEVKQDPAGANVAEIVIDHIGRKEVVLTSGLRVVIDEQTIKLDLSVA